MIWWEGSVFCTDDVDSELSYLSAAGAGWLIERTPVGEDGVFRLEIGEDAARWAKVVARAEQARGRFRQRGVVRERSS